MHLFGRIWKIFGFLGDYQNDQRRLSVVFDAARPGENKLGIEVSNFVKEFSGGHAPVLLSICPQISCGPGRTQFERRNTNRWGGELSPEPISVHAFLTVAINASEFGKESARRLL